MENHPNLISVKRLISRQIMNNVEINCWIPEGCFRILISNYISLSIQGFCHKQELSNWLLLSVLARLESTRLALSIYCTTKFVPTNITMHFYNPHGSTPQCRCCLRRDRSWKVRRALTKYLGHTCGAHARAQKTVLDGVVFQRGDMLVVFVETTTENAWHLSS